MIQPIYLLGSEVLREKATEFDLSDKEGIANLIANLQDTLAFSEGCGLAAPQIGVSKRVVIVDGTGMVDSYDYLKDFKRTLINPVIKEESEETCVFNEGCLSVPGVYGDVVRPSKITVEYTNENLERVTETFDRFAARMVQHELSHLDGCVFTDLLAPIRRKIVGKKILKVTKGQVSTHYKTKIK